MTAAADIFDEVEADATALNGEVVRRAINGHCCNFVNQQTEFAELLNYYIALRLDVRRIKYWLEGGGSLQVARAWPEKGYATWDRLHVNRIMAEDARRRLKNLWPCAACIWLYNPTHRFRRFP